MREVWWPFSLTIEMVCLGGWLALLLGVVVVPIAERVCFATQWSAWRRAVICLAVAYGAWAGPAHVRTAYLDSHLDAFDLDHDGIFAGADCDPATASPSCEATPEQGLAMQRVTNDLARNLRVVTGMLVAPLAPLAGLEFAALLSRFFPRLKRDRPR